MVTGGGSEGSGGGGRRVGGRHGEVDRSCRRMGSGFFSWSFLLFFLAPVTKSAKRVSSCRSRAEWGSTQCCGVFTTSLQQGREESAHTPPGTEPQTTGEASTCSVSPTLSPTEKEDFWLYFPGRTKASVQAETRSTLGCLTQGQNFMRSDRVLACCSLPSSVESYV